ncbi:MAG: hypothetical protein M1812_002930 [Candelaria pacifica]|nr:MAG: hypothetical protein M1812_002930 [Candelaria pacifica]
MELAVAISKGPFNQIAFPLISLDSAIQLAIGAAGWYKGRERALSLQQTFHARQASLVPADTFIRERYRRLRDGYGGVYGAVVGPSRKLLNIPLPGASTAVTEDPGLDCLRALIVGLSCFVDEQQTISLLKESLPQYMLHYNQDDPDQPQALEGACLAATIQFVIAVRHEDGVDRLKEHLHAAVSRGLERVTNASLQELLASQYTELAQISGMLRWALAAGWSKNYAPLGKPDYNTRSLKVWALALVLAELGFNIEASKSAVTLPYMSELHQPATHGLAEVILVLASGWPTDTGAVDALDYGVFGTRIEVTSQPRIVPIRAVPAMAFTDFGPRLEEITPEAVDQSFFATFTYVQDFLKGQAWACSASGSPLHTAETFKVIKTPPHAPLNRRQQEYIEELTKSWTIGNVEHCSTSKVFLEHLKAQLILFVSRYATFDSDRDVQAMFLLIVMSWILAVASFFARQEGKEDPLDFDFVYSHPFSKISKPLFGYKPNGPAPRILELSPRELRYCDLSELFRSIASTLSFIYVFWSESKESRTFEKASLQLARQEGGRAMMSVLAGYRLVSEGEIFGIQFHGLAVVSDFLLGPSLLPSKAFVFHIQRGQLLDFPLQSGRIRDGKFTRTHKVVLKAADVLLNSVYDLRKIEACDWLRWDVEPCWERDPQTCCLCYRVGGIPRFYLGLAELLSTIDIDSRNTVTCKDCAHDPLTDPLTISAFKHQSWLELPLVNMLKAGQLAVTDVEGLNRPPSVEPINWIAQVGDEDMLAMLSLVCKFARALEPERRILTDCIVSGLERAVELKTDERESILLVVRSLR